MIVHNLKSKLKKFKILKTLILLKSKM